MRRAKSMALGLSSFNNSRNNSGPMETSGQVASAESQSMIAGLFSTNSSTNVETSGQVASLFSSVINLDNNGNEAGGEVIFGGGFSGSTGGGDCGGGMSLA
jgi:hypothetical protein